MKLLPLFVVAAAMTVPAFAQPTIGAVTNAASYALPGLPNSGIAQGSMFIIWGTGLSAGTGASGFPLKTNLAGTSAQVTVGGRTVDALPVLLVSDRVYAVLPSSTPTGTGTITVTYNGQTSRPAEIRVVRATFGMFTINQAGSGPVVVQNFVSQTDQPINTLTTPARPGQTVTIWGTGLGPVTGDELAAALGGTQVTDDVEVYIGGKRATVVYKGRSGCCAGLDQLVITVPDVEGCYVPVVVKIGDSVSNFTSMSIAKSGNSCSDATLRSDDLEKARTSGQYRGGVVGLSRTVSKMSFEGMTADMKTDSGSGSFWRYTYDQLLRSSGGSSGMQLTVGSCSVYTYRGESANPVDPITPTALNAGPTITITGPKGTKTMNWDAQAKGYYAKLGGGMQINLPPGTPPIPGLPGSEPDYLEAGEYTITNGNGGPDVGQFTVRMTLREMLQWSNMDAINNVNRGSGVTVNWTGGAADQYVYITGGSAMANGNVGAGFICLAPSSARTFTVPSYVLSTLPASSQGTLMVGGTAAQTPLTATGIDYGQASITSAAMKTVTYQ